jgi:hypothetical protein
MSKELLGIVIRRTQFKSVRDMYGYAEGIFDEIYLLGLEGPTKNSKHYPEWSKYYKGKYIQLIE